MDILVKRLTVCLMIQSLNPFLDKAGKRLLYPPGKWAILTRQINEFSGENTDATPVTCHYKVGEKIEYRHLASICPQPRLQPENHAMQGWICWNL